MTQYAYLGGAPPSLSSPARRGWILLSILALHILVIGGPWFWMFVHGKLMPPKENRFKVKLGELTPSHAPEVGPPERTRPTPAPPAPPAPAPPEPTIQPPRPKVKPAPPEPKITRPKPRPQPKEPTIRPPRKAKPSPQPPEPKIPRTTSKSTGKNQKQSQNRRQSRHVDPKDQVYQPPGGWNFNPNVPIGTRDRGQVKGPADHKTPQGGLTQEDVAYYAALKRFLDPKWTAPSRTVLGDQRPTAVLELTIAADGRVLRARIVESSGNVSMDNSVKRLIKVLDRVPAPPHGELTILIDMEVD